MDELLGGIESAENCQGCWRSAGKFLLEIFEITVEISGYFTQERFVVCSQRVICPENSYFDRFRHRIQIRKITQLRMKISKHRTQQVVYKTTNITSLMHRIAR